MSIFHQNALIGASGQGAAGPTAGRSVRFNAPDSAYLSRTPASAGNRKTWTWSGWVKRSKLAANNYLLGSASNSSNYAGLFFNSSDQLSFVHIPNANTINTWTNAVFRDASAWYHVVVAVDTTQSTGANGVKIYVNNVQQTLTIDAYTQNADTLINSTNTHGIGALGSTFIGLDGYLALVHFIDGQALTPSSFGETSATTGQWIAKTYSGSYGTNGFFLNFSDNSAATSTTLGKDAAGSNNWTPNNLSVTAGSGNDSLRDHPTSAGTSTGAGGEVSGNYATLNLLRSTGSLANGSLDYTNTTSTTVVTSTYAVSSGKWYWEVTPTNTDAHMLGILQSTVTIGGSYPLETTGGYGYYQLNGRKYPGNIAYGATYAANDVIGFALNMDAGSLVIYKNGVSQGTFITGLTGFWSPAAGTGANTGTQTGTFNFGQRAWSYTAPAGFSPLVDTLLPTPTIAKPNTVMDVALYTGNGSTQTVSGLQFSPDFVWLKSRNNSGNHRIYDTVRGATFELYPNLTAAQGTAAQNLTAFNSDGFSLGTGAGTNGSGVTYAGWCFDAGSSNATNTSGTITSTVRANISAGFSIVTYTGTGSSATVGHGLGNAPSFYVIKRRDAASSSLGWIVFSYLNGTLNYGRFDSTSAFASAGESAPTSSVFSILTNADINANGGTYVAYCWTPVAGYSAFGSYTGSTSKPFVYLGFRPKVVWIKGITSNAYTSYMSWYISDSARDTDNPQNGTGILWANRSDAEGNRGDGTAGGSFLDVDFLSNGFRILDTTSVAELNFTGATYIYCAWAEAPFPYARAR